jgi:DNA-directed RNA polymerase subunit RPC12/RpoP
MSQGKTIGGILAGIGVAILLLAVAWALTSAIEPSAKVLAIIFGLIVAAPLLGFGIYTFTKGQAEAGEEKVIAKERKLLSMVMTQGKVNIADATLELQTSRDQTRQLIYDLIGKQLFTGYVNWQDGMLYSADASKIKEGGKCPNCGGKLELAGKGVIKCPYCGSEIFLSQ